MLTWSTNLVLYLADTLSRVSLKNITQSKAEEEIESIYATDFLPISEPQLKEIQAETAWDDRPGECSPDKDCLRWHWLTFQQPESSVDVLSLWSLSWLVDDLVMLLVICLC